MSDLFLDEDACLKKIFMRYFMQQMRMKMQINGKIVHKGQEDVWGIADLAPDILKFSARSRCV
jgi:hypothetical protein